MCVCINFSNVSCIPISETHVEINSISHGYSVYCAFNDLNQLLYWSTNAIYSAECWAFFAFFPILLFSFSLIIIIWFSVLYTLIIIWWRARCLMYLMSWKEEEKICFLITSKNDGITNLLFPPSRLCTFMICTHKFHAHTWSSSSSATAFLQKYQPDYHTSLYDSNHHHSREMTLNWPQNVPRQSLANRSFHHRRMIMQLRIARPSNALFSTLLQLRYTFCLIVLIHSKNGKRNNSVRLLNQTYQIDTRVNKR